MTASDQRAYFFKIDTTIKKVRYVFQKRLDEAGMDLTVDQWVLLDHVFHYPAISQNVLAEMTAKDNPTVTRILDLLVKKGLVERRMSEEDRRKFNIYLTEAGEQKFHAAFPVVAEVRRMGWANLSDNDFDDLVRILDTIYLNITG
ncbi:MarR family winged helix-turn-helix transcriptional regulator [Siphonobacter aquaeclarae]|jgi:DNA-binding MarR family transcriptional regulator|uniref:Transcriptional regulator, MarR family n=1 Tax=Siphonobacter aquaeclarae TaxID=563176 RepID=A0A1G9V130_9BACT|nr:MarR family transcriptional regulator [Siphonobacter aquaeclarae]MBO9640548.1 MarR family transcriptional regulator [Siphonobacter aquaeclarae]SDM65615.1 transcriptional regulator, MarR family [Siphonobacter aquaeclarae]